MRSITKTEGFRGLFAGYGSFLLRDLPFDAIEFVAYEQLKQTYKASLTEVREPNSLETSAIGIFLSFFPNPFPKWFHLIAQGHLTSISNFHEMHPAYAFPQ